MQNLYNLLAFLLIAIAVSIYCYMIKYQIKHLKKIKTSPFCQYKLKISVKNINKKPHILLFDDILNIKEFNPNNIKIDEKSNKNILIYYIGYVTIKKDLKIYSVNPLYLIFGKVNRYFEEINENKYLALVSTNESKEK